MDEDLKLLIKRISLTILAFGVFFAVNFLIDGDNPFFESKVNKTVVDSVYVLSMDGNQSMVVITYKLELDTDLMSDYNKGLYERNADQYISNNLLIPIRDNLKDDVVHHMSFTDSDAFRNFRYITTFAIREPMSFLNYTETGITVKSFDTELYHDERVVQQIENRRKK